MELPFSEKINNGFYIRTFSSDLNENELKWHFDEEDRIVICENDTDWLFQFDNELPITINKNEPIVIQKNIYHRIIKGTNNLKLKIKKL
jgi:hypothetical protein